MKFSKYLTGQSNGTHCVASILENTEIRGARQFISPDSQSFELFIKSSFDSISY